MVRKKRPELTPEQRAEIGRKLTEARIKAKAVKEANKIEYSKYIWPLDELRKAMNDSEDDYETTVFKLIESRKANIQAITEITGMDYLEVKAIIESHSKVKLKDGY